MASNGSNATVTTSYTEWNSLHTSLTIFALIIVIVNLPVVVLYFKISSLRHSAGNTFLVGLAVADILSACLTIPPGITCELGVLERDHHNNMCIFFWVSNVTVSLGSIYHIVAATVAKYFAIVHPMRNITACTKSRVHFVIASIWFGSFLIGHVPIYVNNMGETQGDKMLHYHAIFLVVFAFAIPTWILTAIHVHIYFRLFLNSRPRALITETNTRSENNRRIAILFSVLFLFFVISWLPYYLMWASLIRPEPKMADAFGMLRFLAAVVNPLMFTFAKRDFRKAASSLVNRLRGRRDLSGRRSHHTQATSSVDRSNFIEQQNAERIMKIELAERDETVNENKEMQMI